MFRKWVKGSNILIKREKYLAENRKPKFFYGYLVVLAAFCVMGVVYGTVNTFGVFFKPLLTEFGWTRAMTSGAFSLYMLLHGLVSIVSGRLNDKFGPRVVITIFGFFLGSGYLLMSQIGVVWQLYLFYGVIVALGSGAGFVPLASTVARWFVKRRGLMTGIVLTGTGIGTMILPPVANQLNSAFGWRNSYIIVGAIALVLTVSAAQVLRRDPAQMGQLPYGADEVKPESPALEGKGFSLREAIQTKQLWIVSALSFCYAFSLYAVMVHIAPHAIDLGISATIAANLIAVIGGLSIAGRIIMGSGSDRIGAKFSYVIAFTMMALALFWLPFAREVWMLYLFAAIFGFAYGGLITFFSPLVAELFGLGSHGVILGISTSVGTIGGAIAPVLTGGIFDLTGSYDSAFLVTAAVSVLGLIMALLLTPISSKGGGNDSGKST